MKVLPVNQQRNQKLPGFGAHLDISGWEGRLTKAQKEILTGIAAKIGTPEDAFNVQIDFERIMKIERCAEFSDVYPMSIASFVKGKLGNKLLKIREWKCFTEKAKVEFSAFDQLKKFFENFIAQ